MTSQFCKGLELLVDPHRPAGVQLCTGDAVHGLHTRGGVSEGAPPQRPLMYTTISKIRVSYGAYHLLIYSLLLSPCIARCILPLVTSEAGLIHKAAEAVQGAKSL